MRFGGRDDAHLQDVDLRPGKGARQLPASREETFQASFEVGVRTPGSFAAAPGAVAGSTNVGSRSSSLARSTRCRTLRERDPAADVFPFRACCSWLRILRKGAQTTRTGSNCFFVDGATRLTGPNPVSHPPHEPPFDRQREGSGGGGRTRETRRHVHVELSRGDAGDTANREGHPRHFASPPRSRRTTRSRRRDGQNCGHRAPRGCPTGPPSGGTLGPFRVRRSVSRSVTS